MSLGMKPPRAKRHVTVTFPAKKLQKCPHGGSLGRDVNSSLMFPRVPFGHENDIFPKPSLLSTDLVAEWSKVAFQYADQFSPQASMFRVTMVAY